MDRKKSFCRILKNIRRRILKEAAEKIVPAVYLFGQTSDNQNSVLSRGKELWEQGFVSQVLVNDGETKHGYPGYELWRKELLRMGVAEKAIVPLRAGILNENINTLTEAQALVRHARSQEWEGVYIAAAPFHQLRAFISTVSALLNEYPSLLVYTAVGVPLRWSETVRHSQGTLVGKRRSFLKTETERIYRYCLKGDPVPPQEVLNYLNWHDKKIHSP